jgi:hypothetical protein
MSNAAMITHRNAVWPAAVPADWMMLFSHRLKSRNRDVRAEAELQDDVGVGGADDRGDRERCHNGTDGELFPARLDCGGCGLLGSGHARRLTSAVPM